MRNPTDGIKRPAMRRGRQIRQNRSLGILPAVLAALAMAAQLMIPAAAMAWEARADQTRQVVMCTADGAVTMTVPDSGGHHKGFAGLKCHSCVIASVTAIAAEAPVVEPVRYAARIELARPGSDRPGTSARDPPRPPSTAPPAPTNA